MDEHTEQQLDALQAWASKNATSMTGRFDETAEMAEIVLGFLSTDRIGHSA